MSLEAHHRFILDTMQRNQDIARNIINGLEAENARLKAEVERLTKAGDELERVLISRSGSYEAGNASYEWQSAKNYKPSV